MKYLDENITATVRGFQITNDGVYRFDIINGEENIVFAGNTFMKSGDTSVEIELNDFVESLKDVNKSIELPLNSSMYTKTGLFDTYTVKLYVGENTYLSDGIQVAHIYRYPNRKTSLEPTLFDWTNTSTLSRQNCLQGAKNGSIKLMPVIPYMKTGNYGIGFEYEVSRYHNSLSINLPISTDGAVFGKAYDSRFYNPSSMRYYKLSYLFHESNYARVLTPELITCEGSWVEAGDTYVNASSTSLPLISVRSELDYQVDFNTQLGTVHCEAVFSESNIDEFEIEIMLNEDVNDIIYIECSEFTYGTQRISFDVLVSSSSGRYITNVKNIKLYSGDTNAKDAYVYVDGEKAAKIDVNCMSKYYLQWFDRYGGIQSQRFDKVDTFSESITRSNKTNFRNEKSLSVADITPKWKIQTGYLSEELYPYYESILCSPYLLLFDAENNVSYNVVVTDTSYTEKTIQNQGNKLFNLALNLELNKHQIIKY